MSVLSPTTYTVGHTLEFVATFRGQPNQNVGFGLTSALIPPFAMFGIKSDGQLYARSVAPGQSLETPIPGSWLGAPHRFRIDWNPGSVVYWIDGAQKATHSITYPAKSGSMRPAIADLTAGDGTVTVDWMRMSAYTGSGVYTSPVYDGGSASATWLSASWLADVPSGTTVSFQITTGNTATPDGSWTPWANYASGATINQVARYAQYRLTLSTTIPNSAPSVKEVVVNIQR
jgi:hypothetical protein